jgi:hypothetical protein
MSSLPIQTHDQNEPLPFRVVGDMQDQAPINSGITDPLTDAHMYQLQLICKQAKSVEKAARYAHFSGWSTLLAGAFTIPFAISKPSTLVFAMVIAGIGTRELSIRRQLKTLDVRAPKKLALNQLMLGSALVAYAVFMLVSSPGAGMVESAMSTDPILNSTPELGSMMNDLVELERFATALMYVAMIVIAILVQGSTALFYKSKIRKLIKLHRATPHWTLRVYQTMHS